MKLFVNYVLLPYIHPVSSETKADPVHIEITDEKKSVPVNEPTVPPSPEAGAIAKPLPVEKTVAPTTL